MPNLRCMNCFHIMEESEAVDDQFCPECSSDMLWETSSLTADQIDDDLAETHEVIEAAEEDRRFQRQLTGTDALVSSLKDIMGGV